MSTMIYSEMIYKPIIIIPIVLRAVGIFVVVEIQKVLVSLFPVAFWLSSSFAH